MSQSSGMEGGLGVKGKTLVGDSLCCLQIHSPGQWDQGKRPAGSWGTLFNPRGPWGSGADTPTPAGQLPAASWPLALLATSQLPPCPCSKLTPCSPQPSPHSCLQLTLTEHLLHTRLCPGHVGNRYERIKTPAFLELWSGSLCSHFWPFPMVCAWYLYPVLVSQRSFHLISSICSLMLTTGIIIIAHLT